MLDHTVSPPFHVAILEMLHGVLLRLGMQLDRAFKVLTQIMASRMRVLEVFAFPGIRES